MPPPNLSLHTVESCLDNTELTESGCLLWLGSVRGQMGYAQFSKKVGTGSRAGHVEVFLAYNGDVPPDYDVGHTCDNPRCINPEHLVLQTRSQNLRQAVERRRHVSNLDKAEIKVGTEEFNERVRIGVTRTWKEMTTDEYRQRCINISKGKRQARRRRSLQK